MTALAFVGHATGYATGSATTIASAARAFTGGNHIFVCVRWESSDTTITVADTAGNTYTALTRGFGNSVGGQWFHCLSAVGHASNVITATFAAARTYRSIYAIEVSGTAASVEEIAPSSATANTTLSHEGYVYGAGSFLLASSSTYNTDSSPAFGGSQTLTKLTQTSSFHAVAHAADSTGSSAGSISVTGASNSRTFATLVVDSGEPPPAVATVARLSQLPVEVIRTNTGVAARISQLPVEVLRINTGTVIRASQLALEVLRPNADPVASSARPVCFVCT